MKRIEEYILEKFKISKNIKTQEYKYHPKDRNELKSLIEELIKERGEEANLNDIDVSDITDMYHLFYNSKFNGDISKWNVSNVKDMGSMFFNSKFDGDISNWNVSNVKNMTWMFYQSNFNGDISKWNISNVNYMDDIFYNSPLEKNPPAWYHE